MSRWAETGAVMNKNRAMSNSCRLGLPCATLNHSAEAMRMQPTPKVVAFVGPCRRFRKLPSLARPQEPTKANPVPNTTKVASRASSQTGKLEIAVFMAIDVVIGITPNYSAISPRSRNFDSTTVPMNPSMAITSAASKYKVVPM